MNVEVAYGIKCPNGCVSYGVAIGAPKTCPHCMAEFVPDHSATIIANYRSPDGRTFVGLSVRR